MKPKGFEKMDETERGVEGKLEARVDGMAEESVRGV